MHDHHMRYIRHTLVFRFCWKVIKLVDCMVLDRIHNEVVSWVLRNALTYSRSLKYTRWSKRAELQQVYSAEDSIFSNLNNSRDLEVLRVAKERWNSGQNSPCMTVEYCVSGGTVVWSTRHTRLTDSRTLHPPAASRSLVRLHAHSYATPTAVPYTHLSPISCSIVALN